MIITQTPFRVSFAGGGTDLPAFYREEYGAVLSTAIRQHMYVTVGPRFDPTIRISYMQTEIVDEVGSIQHTIAREALRHVDLDSHLEITTIADVPAGTGLGSSSSLTVGILNALYAYRGIVSGAEKLSREACEIEIDRLGKPIGRQDQYAAGFGGLNYIRFFPDDTVAVEPVPCRREVIQELERRSLILFTEQSRNADGILEQQSKGTADRISVLRQMRDLAGEMRAVLGGSGNLDEFAALLHAGWELKRSLGFGIATQSVDEWYQAARRAGAQGGKLLGAGGGGFLYLLAEPERHAAIRDALGNPRELDFRVDPLGSRVIFISDAH